MRVTESVNYTASTLGIMYYPTGWMFSLGLNFTNFANGKFARFKFRAQYNEYMIFTCRFAEIFQFSIIVK